MNDPLAPATASPPDVRVWDGLLRLTHWSFPLLILVMWWTAENDKWAWHRRTGLVLLGILAFRVLWGFIGPETARFASFVKGPRAVLAYLRGDTGAGPAIGHSPIGGWSTMVLLGAMLAQVSMGLFSGDPYDGMTGPLNPLFGVMTADMITDWHETFFNVLAGLIVLHLCAIVFYASVKQNDLVSPMLSGARPPLAGVAGIAALSWGRGLLAIALAAGFALWIAYGAPPLT